MHTPVLIVSPYSRLYCNRLVLIVCHIKVGGGPSGLVLALSLLLNGVNVRIIDKELSHRTGSKGNGISVSFVQCISRKTDADNVAAQVARSVSFLRTFART
jgi:2-polyprenyl-6-methoxyphenol hydroxylase-like FAD-dependent oxidoreductase